MPGISPKRSWVTLSGSSTRKPRRIKSPVGQFKIEVFFQRGQVQSVGKRSHHIDSNMRWSLRQIDETHYFHVYQVTESDGFGVVEFFIHRPGDENLPGCANFCVDFQ